MRRLFLLPSRIHADAFIKRLYMNAFKCSYCGISLQYMRISLSRFRDNIHDSAFIYDKGWFESIKSGLFLRLCQFLHCLSPRCGQALRVKLLRFWRRGGPWILYSSTQTLSLACWSSRLLKQPGCQDNILILRRMKTNCSLFDTFNVCYIELYTNGYLKLDKRTAIFIVRLFIQ